MTGEEKISVVVTCFNQCNLTLECINAILKSTVKPFEIILVDNGSMDDTRKTFEEFSGIKYIRRNVNDGSIIGRNIGLQEAHGTHVFVLDNDQIVSPDTIENYLKFDTDLIGAVLCECNELGIGREIETILNKDLIYLGIGGLMVKRKVFQEIGFLDDGFSPAYCDDPDFFWRCIDAGYTWSWCKDNHIEHRAHTTLTKVKTLDNDFGYRCSHARLRNKYPKKFPVVPVVEKDKDIKIIEEIIECGKVSIDDINNIRDDRGLPEIVEEKEVKIKEIVEEVKNNISIKISEDNIPVYEGVHIHEIRKDAIPDLEYDLNIEKPIPIPVEIMERIRKAKKVDNTIGKKIKNKLQKGISEFKRQAKFSDDPLLVSYVIPTYNRVKFLPACIDSILSQTYPHIEIIVVDDGSTDGTGEMIKEKYPMVTYLFHENHKIPYTLNRGIKAANGKFICWLSSDDGVYNNKTEVQVKYMEEHPEIDLSFHEYNMVLRGEFNNGTWVDYSKEILRQWKPQYYGSMRDEFLYSVTNETCNHNGSTSMFRKSAFKKMGYFIEQFYYVQDWEMWLRYLRDGNLATIPEVLGWRIEHDNVGQGTCVKNPVAVKRFNYEKEFVRNYYRMFTIQDRPTICAMLCVKNEEEMIERCLDDLILWVDKIVVLDDGSTDRTPEIIRQYPKVVDIYTNKDKGNVRNEGQDRQRLLEMAQATGCDWILFIDADEVFENRMKVQIFDLISREEVNLWHFHEINLWRSENKYRVDEMFDKGWFGRLFRNFPNLRVVNERNEHCGGIPYNIPDCTQWGESEKGKKSNVGVKHYGFVTYDRTVERAYRRWIRDPFRVESTGEKRGGWFYYDRMVNETGLELVEYEERLS